MCSDLFALIPTIQLGKCLYESDIYYYLIGTLYQLNAPKLGMSSVFIYLELGQKAEEMLVYTFLSMQNQHSPFF